MQKVGHHLQMEAVKRMPGDQDIFARSAYNRYYYTVFLTVRSLFSQFKTEWAEMGHSSYPEILRGQITKSFKVAKTRAHKNSDWELVSILDSGLRAASALATLMIKANGIRVVADYEPSESVNFTTASRFSLKSIDISEAHDWDSSVRVYTNAIREAWKQINV